MRLSTFGRADVTADVAAGRFACVVVTVTKETRDDVVEGAEGDI